MTALNGRKHVQWKTLTHFKQRWTTVLSKSVPAHSGSFLCFVPVKGRGSIRSEPGARKENESFFKTHLWVFTLVISISVKTTKPSSYSCSSPDGAVLSIWVQLIHVFVHVVVLFCCLALLLVKTSGLWSLRQPRCPEWCHKGEGKRAKKLVFVERTATSQSRCVVS